MVSKIMKYLGINLTKEVKDLNAENNKAFMKETEEHTNKLKIHCVYIFLKNINWKN